MMIEVGNIAPIEAIQNPDGPPGDTVYVSLSGPRVTTFRFPEGLSVEVATIAVVDAMQAHSTDAPAWVDGNPAALVKKLCAHYGIAAKDNKRPAYWGKS